MREGEKTAMIGKRIESRQVRDDPQVKMLDAVPCFVTF
jgi:hypothetical protein